MKTSTLLCISVILFFLVSVAAADDRLRPFTSDGCSVFPDGTIWKNDLWLDCCVEHDKAYWKGGTYEERRLADERLKECVKAKGEPFIAEVMEEGVRAGGSPFFPTSYRWGYGWPYLQGYRSLTEEEKDEAEKLLEQFEASQGTE